VDDDSMGNPNAGFDRARAKVDEEADEEGCDGRNSEKDAASAVGPLARYERRVESGEQARAFTAHVEFVGIRRAEGRGAQGVGERLQRFDLARAVGTDAEVPCKVRKLGARKAAVA
jgi:hypothetical protein